MCQPGKERSSDRGRQLSGAEGFCRKPLVGDLKEMNFQGAYANPS